MEPLVLFMPVRLLLELLVHQDSMVVVTAVAVEHPAVQAEGLEAQEGLAVSLEAAAVLVE